MTLVRNGLTPTPERIAQRQPCIVAAGHYLPEREVTNEEIAGFLDVRPEDIERRTGIRSRRWVEGRVYTSDLATRACRDVVDKFGIDLAEIDCLIAATMTPDYVVAPGIGVHVQVKLGLGTIPCFDVRDQCSGFLYALQMARAFVIAGIHRRILVVCAELQSHGLGRSPEHAHTTPLFADGAGAVVVADRADGPGAGGLSLDVRWLRTYADGSGSVNLRHRIADVSLHPPWDIAQLDEPASGVLYPEMNGELVFRRAVRTMADTVNLCFAETGITQADVTHLLPHQANRNINAMVAALLRFPPEKMLGNIDRVGNTSSASMPILLSESLENGTIRAGDRVLCVGFGAGYTWGGMLLEFGS